VRHRKIVHEEIVTGRQVSVSVRPFNPSAPLPRPTNNSYCM
jgi:hypothetical protein